MSQSIYLRAHLQEKTEDLLWQQQNIDSEQKVGNDMISRKQVLKTRSVCVLNKKNYRRGGIRCQTNPIMHKSATRATLKQLPTLHQICPDWPSLPWVDSTEPPGSAEDGCGHPPQPPPNLTSTRSMKKACEKDGDVLLFRGH